jgi:phage shock protein A
MVDDMAVDLERENTEWRHQRDQAITRRDEALAQQAITTMKSSSASRQATI